MVYFLNNKYFICMTVLYMLADGTQVLIKVVKTYMESPMTLTLSGLCYIYYIYISI